jgi:hypothetical protein
MMEQLFREPGHILGHMHNFTRKNPEVWEPWYKSQVAGDLMRILGQASRSGRWVTNPYLAAISFQHALFLLPMIGNETWASVVENWMWKFGLCKLEPKPTQEEIRTKFDALNALVR